VTGHAFAAARQSGSVTPASRVPVAISIAAGAPRPALLAATRILERPGATSARHRFHERE